MPNKPVWKRLTTKQLLNHPRLTVFEDDIVLPNGEKSTYLHFGEATHAAMIIAINDEGKILVQKEYSYPPNEWLYQFPGGGLKPQEAPLEGAHRELAEEANLTGDMEQIGWFYVDNRRRQDKMYVFIARNLQAVPGEKDAEEAFEYSWLAPKQIGKLIAEGQITNFSILAGWALYCFGAA